MNTVAGVFVFGDGNFSYSAALIQLMTFKTNVCPPVVACTLDYEFHSEKSTVAKVRDLGGFVIDQNVNLHKTCHDNYLGTLTKGLPPHVAQILARGNVRVVFNFPHSGTPNLSKANIRSNKLLLANFFTAVKNWFADEATVEVSLKTGVPYDSWELVEVAAENGWQLQHKYPFQHEVLKQAGYRHETTLTPKLGQEVVPVTVSLSSAMTYVFARE
eukprot:Rhum_TRINITY_DN1124_c0_g2::Rhum_TRINITY_DN1124_c0_g2_i1::g.3395::m.3395/K19307/BMT5; 25S rRNA (uracil2634-N3)-methyltransferase